MNYLPNQYIKCDQNNGVLDFYHHNCYESRGASVEKMVRDCVKRFNIIYNFSFLVNTDDIPRGSATNIPIFHFCNNKDLEDLFPDFTYDAWPEIQVDNFSNVIDSLRFDNIVPATNKVGWIGTILCRKREEVLNIFSVNKNFEIIPIRWVRGSDGRLHSDQYMSYYSQVKRWKYLLDIEGGGWSARLKTLLCLPRVTFVIEREWKDWCWNFIKPWEHFIPVKNDLSDLVENYNKIETDKSLYDYILQEKNKVYNMCLTYDSALEQIHYLLNRYAKLPK